MGLTTRVGLEFYSKDKSKTGLQSFSRGLSSISRSIFSLKGAVLGLAGVGGFGMMIRQQMKAIDQISKMSDELDISTRALAGWDHAAQISGTSMEMLHKGLEIFVRRIGEAQYGIGEGKRGLEMLGITSQQLIKMGMEEAFLHIAEKIKEAGTSADRAGLAYQFFGRQGVQLINMFLQGREGIERMTDEAQRMGLVFDRIDGSRVEAAVDAMTRVKGVFVGLFRTTTIELAPYIEAAATAFTNWAMAGEGVGAKISNIFETVAIEAIRTGSEIERLIIRLNALAHPIDYIQKSAEARQQALSRYRSVTGDLVGGTTDMVGMTGVAFPFQDRALFEQMLREENVRRGLAISTEDQTRMVQKFFGDLRKTTTSETQTGRPFSQAEIETMLGRGPGPSHPGKTWMGLTEGWDGAMEQLSKKATRFYGQLGRGAVEAVGEMEWAAGQYRRTLDEQMAAAENELQFVREAAFMTRNEKILYLEQYRDAHLSANLMLQESEQMLNDEILRLYRSRVGGMTLYLTELRDDMQNYSLYMSDLWGQTFQSIEQAGSSAFYSMMAEGASFKDAMVGFARDIGQAFARMASDLAMRTIMGGLFGVGGPAASPAAVLGSRQGGGYIPATGLYQLHAGEEVIERGAGAINVTLKNESGVPLRATALPGQSMRDIVVSLVMEDYDNGGPTSRLFGSR